MDQYLNLYNLGLLSAEDLNIIFQVYADHQQMLRNVPRVLGVPGRFCLQEFSEKDVRDNFRFEKEHLPVLLGSLEIPQVVITGGYKVPGMLALCILLKRLSYPNRLVDLEKFFNMSKSAISAIAIYMTRFINETKGDRLLDLGVLHWLNAERLTAYAEAVARKGAALPNCWAFIDGTARKMCRPTRDQELHYSGHKRFHCLKYQSILTPDGMIVSLQGPFEGRRHDAGIWTGCPVQEQIRRLCITPNRTFILYGDPAYPVSDILIAPYPSTNRQPHAVAFNRSMAPVRQAVEWGFGKVIQQFAFVDFAKNQKYELQDVGGMYRAAVLLTNCHICLYSSQASQFFGVHPPTLEEYLADNN